MAKNALDQIFERAQGSTKRIVLPEGTDERVLKAATLAAKANLGRIVLLGDEDVILSRIPKKLHSNLTVINPERAKSDALAQTLYELRKHKGMTLDEARVLIKKPIMFATMMLYSGDADGVVAGVTMPTADAIRPALQIIKTRAGINKVSSVMLMRMPENRPLGEKGVMLFADCGIIPEPAADDLADIAISTADTARALAGITPRVAMLSFSTASKKDTDYVSVEKVKQATAIVKRRRPDIIIDGEIQADAAIAADVAKIKCPNSILSGRANCLIFPDLNCANIAYKLVSRIGGVEAVGPVLQGLKKPVNDLSRGANSQEIFQAIAVTILQSQG